MITIIVFNLKKSKILTCFLQVASSPSLVSVHSSGSHLVAGGGRLAATKNIQSKALVIKSNLFIVITKILQYTPEAISISISRKEPNALQTVYLISLFDEKRTTAHNLLTERAFRCMARLHTFETRNL